MKPPASVFISYRRSDTGGYAALLHHRLKNWFDGEELFFDLETLEPGDDFTQRIRVAVSNAKVVLALIAPDWLVELNRRAVLPSPDLVRVEVEEALRLNAASGAPRVIPVLLGGGKLPSAPELHETLKPGLERLLSLDVHHFHGKNADWDQQFIRLRELIAAVPGVPAPRYRPPPGAPKPFRIIDHLLSPHFRDPTDALGRVREALLQTRNAAIVVRAALYGMGGVGKTQLALKYSYEYRESYAGVWWFRAETDNTLQLDARDACAEVGAALSDRELPTSTFKQWLAQQEHPWLLVFDNAENADTLRPHLPQGGPHHVIVTSRDPAWGGVARAVELAVWSEKEGADFLAARIPGASRAELERLSRTLGGLQLALEQAAAFLDETKGSVSDYCKQIDGVDTAALVLDEGRASTGYEKSVLATLSLAFPRLTPTAQRLLRISALFSAEPIPERYFKSDPRVLSLLSGGDATDGLAWERTVAELRHYGIAERIDVTSLDSTSQEHGDSTEAAEKALVLHRLTLEVARHALSVRAEDGPLAQLIMHVQMSVAASDPGQWPRFAAVLPHFRNFDRFRSEGWLDRRLHAHMLNICGRYLYFGTALYRESEQLFRAAMELRKSELGEEHRDTLVSMNNLARSLQRQGDIDGARALHEEELAICRRVLGEEHPDTLVSMNNLANALWSRGDLEGARALHEQELKISRRVLGEEHPDTLVSMNNVAAAMWSQGDHAGALALHEHVLLIRSRVLGEDHPATLNSMNNVASSLSSLGNLSGARALHERELAISRRVLGATHPDTLTSMHNLAFTLWEMGLREDAMTVMTRAAEGRASTLGADHPSSKSSLEFLGYWIAEMTKSSPQQDT